MKKYNGWTNWDTWNANLWLNNEESVYRIAMAADSPKQLELDFNFLLFTGTLKNDGINVKNVNWAEIYNGLHE